MKLVDSKLFQTFQDPPADAAPQADIALPSLHSLVTQDLYRNTLTTVFRTIFSRSGNRFANPIKSNSKGDIPKRDDHLEGSVPVTAFTDLDDTFLPSSAPIGGTNLPALNDDGDFDFGAPASAPVQNLVWRELDEFERAASAFPALDGDEGISGPSLEQFESQPLFHATPRVPSSLQSPAPAQFQSPAPQGGNCLAFTQPEEPEPEVVRQWREHQAEKIAQRDEESKKKREETIARTEREIDKFYEEYNAKKERTIRENKENEAEYLSALTDSLSSGTTWSCICDLVLARWHRFHALLRGAVEAEEARGQGARCSWVLTMGMYD